MFSRRLAPTAGHRPLLLLLLVLFSVTRHGIGSSSCGDIHNISFPFQLKSDTPASCGGDDTYTLSCENNRTILSLFAGKYYVRAIDYYNFVIRLADVGIQTTDICSSFPLHSLSPQNFTYGSGYGPWSAGTVLYLNCENPVHSPIYINRTGYCETGRHFAKGFYSYVMAAGEVRVWDVADTCSVEMAAMSSSPVMSEGLGSDQLSFSDVNNMLEYGFDSSWQDIRTCGKCRKRASCFPAGDLNANATCSDFCRFEPSFLSYLWNNFQYNRDLIRLIIGAVFSARFLFAPCAYGFLIYKFRRRHLSTFDSIEGFLRSQNNLVPIRYSYSDIKKMTKGFRHKLGEGGYGSVYKGKLRSGHFVAVKMLSKPKANGQDFMNEVATIGRIHHVNVVQLIGYCAERSKRALVYDFMPNGSLEKYIFSPEGKFSLSCEQMYEISLGVARGIAYLHQGCDMQILHFDIKPHNILLDEDFTPKVSDFGLAKLYPTDESTVTLTAARGTLGYMAPELFYKNIGGVSYKADVYSFGMLLMEMAGKRRNWNSSAASSQIFFPSWVYDQFSEGRNVETRETTEEESEMVKKMMLVALWCIQMKPSDRPCMNKVVEMLEGNIELLDMPPKPFLYPSQMPAGIHGIDRESPNLSGAGVDAITFDISGR